MSPIDASIHNTTQILLFALLLINALCCGYAWYYYGAVANRGKLSIDNDTRKIRLFVCLLTFVSAFCVSTWLLASPSAQRHHFVNAIFYPELLLIHLFQHFLRDDLVPASSRKTEAKV